MTSLKEVETANTWDILESEPPQVIPIFGKHINHGLQHQEHATFFKSATKTRPTMLNHANTNPSQNSLKSYVGNVSTWEGLGQLLVVCVWEGSCFYSHGSSNRESFDRSMTSFEPNISLHFGVYKCRNAAKNSNREMSACISCISACDLLRLISIHSMNFNRIHVWYIYLHLA